MNEGPAGGRSAGINAESVSAVVDNFAEASERLDRASSDIARVSEAVGRRTQDIDQIITDASQLASRLNEASTRIDGVLAKLDGMLGSGDGEGLVAEARATLQSFRQVADTLNARIGTITDGLARFSGQGLRDVEALVIDARRSINRIEQAVSDFEQNPQRIITGGEGTIRRYDGRVRRWQADTGSQEGNGNLKAILLSLGVSFEFEGFFDRRACPGRAPAWRVCRHSGIRAAAGRRV